MKKPLAFASSVALVTALAAHAGAAAPATRVVPASSLKRPRVMTGEIGRRGGTLRIAQISDPKTFNPLLARELYSTTIVRLLFEGLAETNAVTARVEPALAEKWAIGKDGKTYTFTLRDGLQWSDGKPLTADDVTFTFNELVANPRIPSDWGDGLRIDGKLPRVEKADRLRVRFTTAKPFAPFLRAVGTLPILPRHVLAPTLVPKGSPRINQTWGLDADVRKIVGNGPFTLDQYLAGQRVVLRRNPRYWRVDRKGTALPYLDGLVMALVKDTDTMMLKFQGKELDVLDPVQPKDFQLLKRGEGAGGYRLLRGGPDFSTLFLMFNLKRGKGKDGKPAVDPIKQQWFNDVRFRQAVAYGIDRQSIIRNFYRGLATEQIAAEPAQSPFHNPQVRRYDYDPKQAARLLAEAGFRKAGGVLKDAQGRPVAFVLHTNVNNSVRVKTGAQIQADLEKLGIKVTFQPLDFNAMVKKIDASYDWEAIMIGLTAGVEPHVSANVWRSDGKLHMFRMAEPAASPWEQEIDRLFDQGAVTLDEARRKQTYARYQEIVAEQVPFIYTVNQEAVAAVRNNVGNYRFAALGSNEAASSLWNVSEVYLKPIGGSRSDP